MNTNDPTSGMRDGPRRVLLVDDNPGDARLVIELIRLNDPDAYEFFEARTMGEAREVVSKTAFSAVFVDLGLPDGVGVDNVRTICGLTDAPVVVLTGSEDRRQIADAQDAGAVAYLSKMDMDETVLSELLARLVA